MISYKIFWRNNLIKLKSFTFSLMTNLSENLLFNKQLLGEFVYPGEEFVFCFCFDFYLKFIILPTVLLNKFLLLFHLQIFIEWNISMWMFNLISWESLLQLSAPNVLNSRYYLKQFFSCFWFCTFPAQLGIFYLLSACRTP